MSPLIHSVAPALPHKIHGFCGAPFWQALVASLGGKMRLKLFEPTEANLYAEGRRKASFNASFDAAPFPQNAGVLGAHFVASYVSLAALSSCFAFEIAASLAPRKDAIAFPRARAGQEYTPAK